MEHIRRGDYCQDRITLVKGIVTEKIYCFSGSTKCVITPITDIGLCQEQYIVAEKQLEKIEYADNELRNVTILVDEQRNQSLFLGMACKDIVTGFRGYCVARRSSLYDECDQYLLEMGHEFKLYGEWFDEERLMILDIDSLYDMNDFSPK